MRNEKGQFTKGHLFCGKIRPIKKLFERVCLICGEKFLRWKCHIKQDKGLYCSRNCYNQSQKGKSSWNKGKTGIYSKETLIKMSNASKLRRLSEETKIRIGKAQTKEKHWAWKGGVSKDKNYIKNRMRSWRKNNPFIVKLHSNRRRTLEENLTTTIIQQVYEDNIKKYGTLTCYLCLKPIGFGQDALEHKTPLFRGGTHDKDNLDIAHRYCNGSKGKKTYEEYLINKESNLCSKN